MLYETFQRKQLGVIEHQISNKKKSLLGLWIMQRSPDYMMKQRRKMADYIRTWLSTCL
jgi:exosome complex RNA-binding protein Csl4